MNPRSGRKIPERNMPALVRLQIGMAAMDATFEGSLNDLIAKTKDLQELIALTVEQSLHEQSDKKVTAHLREASSAIASCKYALSLAIARVE